MSSKDDRHVVPNPDGGLDVKAPDAERASKHEDTQAAATARAREITRNTGGKQLFTALTARSGRRTAPAAAILTRRRSE